MKLFTLVLINLFLTIGCSSKDKEAQNKNNEAQENNQNATPTNPHPNIISGSRSGETIINCTGENNTSITFNFNKDETADSCTYSAQNQDEEVLFKATQSILGCLSDEKNILEKTGRLGGGIRLTGRSFMDHVSMDCSQEN